MEYCGNLPNTLFRCHCMRTIKTKMHFRFRHICTKRTVSVFWFLWISVFVNIYQRYPYPKMSKGIPVNTYTNLVDKMFPFKRMLKLFIDRKSGAGFDVVQPDIAKWTVQSFVSLSSLTRLSSPPHPNNHTCPNPFIQRRLITLTPRLRIRSYQLLVSFCIFFSMKGCLAKMSKPVFYACYYSCPKWVSTQFAIDQLLGVLSIACKTNVYTQIFSICS